MMPKLAFVLVGCILTACSNDADPGAATASKPEIYFTGRFDTYPKDPIRDQLAGATDSKRTGRAMTLTAEPSYQFASDWADVRRTPSSEAVWTLYLTRARMPYAPGHAEPLAGVGVFGPTVSFHAPPPLSGKHVLCTRMGPAGEPEPGPGTTRCIDMPTQ